jgi:hypothetical protein
MADELDEKKVVIFCRTQSNHPSTKEMMIRKKKLFGGEFPDSYLHMYATKYDRTYDLRFGI